MLSDTFMFVTLITGASMGIGEAFAREFASRGHNLLLVARSDEKLSALAEELQKDGRVRVEVCVEDLSVVGGPARVYEFCCRQQIKVDLLVNCAGLSRAGGFYDIPTGKIEEIVMVNMMALALLTRLFLSDMVERNKGGIMNIASLGGLQGVPGLGLYSATKAFVITLSEALYMELKGKGVKVVAVCPGFIETGFFERAAHNTAHLRLPLSGVDVVVKAAINGLKKNKLYVYPTLLDTVLALSQRVVSRKAVIRLAGFFAAVPDG